MTYQITVTMRNSDKFQSTVNAESLEQLTKDLTGKSAIQL